MMKRVGIVGGGQLGLMLGEAGRSMGLECLFLDPAPDAPARRVGTLFQHGYGNITGLRELASRVDVITYELEHIPVDELESVAAKIPVCPPLQALRMGQDRLSEKTLFRELGIPTAAFRAVDNKEDLEAAMEGLGSPLLLKTRRLGYDGKGQLRLRSSENLTAALRTLGNKPMIAEEIIGFQCELSVIGVRSQEGDTRIYPVTENLHRNGMLQISRAPAGSVAIQRSLTDYLERLLSHLDYVGVLALEAFVVDGRLLANEIAPRVHNSGHWTIEGAHTSQFENHLRAVTGRPLGDTSAKGHAGMVNLIGKLPQNPQAIIDAGFHLHDYGKEARPARKLGHVTWVADSAESRDRRLEELQGLLRH